MRVPSLVKNLRIGTKLAIGLGTLVAITFMAAAMSYLGSAKATRRINLTDDVRVPAAILAERAQADLLRMQADVRGYLALGDAEYRESYDRHHRAFQAALADLEALSPHLDADDLKHLQALQEAHAGWSELPEKLFALRDDPMNREPAYRLLATEGKQLAGRILIGAKIMLDAQARREPTAKNTEILGEMAKFQSTFTSLFSGLRSFVTTRDEMYRQEYRINLTANTGAWERLGRQKGFLTPALQKAWDDIDATRKAFLAEIPDRLFAILAGERWREDLYLFRSRALPAAKGMESLLIAITGDQQEQLRRDLARGRQDLTTANWMILAGGMAALLFCIGFAYFAHRSLAGPVRRLTGVVEKIRAGDLEARAEVESADEIGVLAGAFNTMAAKLGQTLLQVTREKTRADSLLDVVIPIGASLSTEKDLDRLLEGIVTEAQSFCRAETGILYLKTPEEALKYVIVRSEATQCFLGGTTGHAIPFAPVPLRSEGRHVAVHAVREGATVNLSRETGPGGFDPASFFPGREGEGEEMVSLLAIPLKNSQGEVLGVLQLLNARDGETGKRVPFDRNLEGLMTSFSLLAAAALEAYIREQSLRQEIRQLKIEIDDSKRQKQVKEIVETDFFRDLTAKARNMRKRSGIRKESPPRDDAFPAR